MKKVKKIIWGAVIALFVLLVAGVIVASFFLGPIVKAGIDTLGPSITKVPVKVNAVHLSLLTGSASIKGLVVGNPKGYQSPQAINAGLIAVGVDPLSVLSDKIVLRTLQLESPQITFEGSLGGNNLSQILDNINGTARNGAQKQGAAATGTNAPAKPSKKFEVDNLLITGAKVHVILTDLGGKQMTLTLPPIHLTNLGKNPEGITAADLSRRVMDAIVGATLKAVANAGTDLGKNAEHLLNNAAKHEAVSNVTRGLKNLLGK